MYSTFTPKNKQIIDRLTRKIDSNENGPKQQAIESRIADDKYKQALEKLRIFKTKNQRNLQQLSHQLQQIEDTLFTIQKSKSKTNDPQNMNYQYFIKFVEDERNENSQKMNLVRKGMSEDIEKKKKTMKADAIQLIEAEFQQSCKSNIIQIEKRVNKITELLQQERLSKQQSAAHLAETIGEQILKVEQTISREKQERKKQNGILFELIGEIQQKIDSQIRQQQRCRQKAQQNLHSRLEELCYKIEAKILGN